MIKQGQEAAKNKPPSPDDQAKTARAELDKVRAKEIEAEISGTTAKAQLDYMAQAQGTPKVYN